jgi:acylglycerol lipase
MIHNEFNWQSTDGLTLYAQAWEPETESKAVVCLVHGLGEHSGRYQHVAKAFTEAGYSMLGFDQRGHGKSGGQRGHAPSEEAFLNDIDGLLKAAAQRYPGKARFLYGHSLGGLLVLFYTLRCRPHVMGVIASSPALRTPLSEQKVKVTFSKALAPLLPTVGLATGLDAKDISRDSQVVQRYQADPLVHDRATFAMAASLARILEWTGKNAEEFPPLPLLLMHGTRDQITYAQGSQEFAARVKGPVTIKLWEGLQHETHNEPEQQQVIAFLVGWVDQQMAVR